MSWICPYCGTENFIEPLNARHWVVCKSCGEGKVDPDYLEQKRAEQIAEIEPELRQVKSRMSRIADELSSLRDEISDREREYDDYKREATKLQQEIDKIKSATIFREVDREAKVRLDIHQKTLPFEGVLV